MALQYEYRARDNHGKLYIGTILAEDERAVAGHVRNKGLFLVKIKEKRHRQDVVTILRNLESVSTKHLAIFCRQFATMLEAGMPILTCLLVLTEQSESRRLRSILQETYKSVQEGSSLGKSFRLHPDVFPEVMTGMIEAGELGGILETTMLRLAIQFEKEHRLNEKVKNAMTYPIVVMLLAIVVVIFVLVFILPTFVGMFKQMDTELPFLTQLLLDLSDILQTYWHWLLAITLLSLVGLRFLFKQPEPRLWLDRVLLNLPVFGMLIRKIAVARFSRTLASLVRGGVPILSALDVVKKTTGNMVITNAITLSQESLKEGTDLSVRLGTTRVFPPMVVQMVAVGEQAGELDKMLDKVADFYEADVEDMVSRLSSMLEPFLIGFLGIAVGTIIIAIFIPMFDVITNVNKIR